MNEEDQSLALNVTRNVCPIYGDCDDFEWTWWWTGLQDLDDDTIWRWNRSKEVLFYITYLLFFFEKGNRKANYTNWNSLAVPNIRGKNCMQLLSGPLDGTWMTFDCNDNFISVHALCQIKLVSFSHNP